MYWFNSLWYSIFNFTSDSLIFTTANIACFTKKKKEKKKSHHPLSLSRFLIIISCHLTEKRDGQKSRIVPASATLQQLQQKWLVTIIVAAVKKKCYVSTLCNVSTLCLCQGCVYLFPHKSFTWQMIKSQLFNC